MNIVVAYFLIASVTFVTFSYLLFKAFEYDSQVHNLRNDRMFNSIIATTISSIGSVIWPFFIPICVVIFILYRYTK